MDVESAFPYTDLDEEVYMSPSPGMDIQKGYCLKLENILHTDWNKYEMIDLGELNHYLGMKITRTDEYNIKADQTQYVKDIIPSVRIIY